MRLPRRAAVVLSAVALSGTLAACGGDADDGTGTGTGGDGVEQPTTPEGNDSGIDDGTSGTSGGGLDGT